MTNEERDEILRTAYETLDRCAQREESEKRNPNWISESPQTLPPRRSYDPVKRSAAEPELDDEPVRHSEPIVTRSAPAPAADWWTAIDQRIASASNHKCT
jgi:hypothetical protein